MVVKQSEQNPEKYEDAEIKIKTSNLIGFCFCDLLFFVRPVLIMLPWLEH